MPRTRLESPWESIRGRTPRPACPRLRGTLEADVAIVGGGAVGCFSAYLLARAGRRVVLVEAGRVAGRGASGSTGLVVPGTGGSFHELRQRVGLKAARHAWEASRRAGLELAALVRRLGIRCDLAPRDHVVIALGEADAAGLERDHRELSDAGLDAAWLPARRVRAGFGLDGVALRVKGGATVDPLRVTLGIAQHARRLGAEVFERSPVRRIRRQARAVEVVAGTGSVVAQQVVIATGVPSPGFGPLARHVSEADQFAVLLPRLPAALKRTLGPVGTSVRERSQAPHTWHWTRGDQLVFQGAEAAPPTPERVLNRVLVQRTGQLMYELSCLHPEVSGTQAEYGWASRIVRTTDGLPVAGPHRNYPRHLFGVAPGESGFNAAFLVARVLERWHCGANEKGDEVFGFLR